MKKIEIPNKKDLENLYLHENIRRIDIAKKYNVSESLVKKWLIYYNISKPYKLRMNNHYDTLKRIYGVSHNSKLESCLNKRKNTSLENYGVVCSLLDKNIKEKSEQTMIEKYGENPTLFGSKHFKQNMLNRYGVEYYSKTKEFNNKFKDEEFKNKWLSKIYKTKKINNSFKKSLKEDEAYDILCKKFGDVLRQYKSELYPFYCDFYIPSIDTYIEYQGHWSHGGEPYIGTDKQNEKVKLWESHNSKYYKIAIDVWTKRDVLKREISKTNNLKYIEFYDIITLKDWVMNYE